MAWKPVIGGWGLYKTPTLTEAIAFDDLSDMPGGVVNVGEIQLSDNDFLYFDTAKTESLRYSTAHGYITHKGSGGGWVTEGEMIFYANTDADANGIWMPFMDFGGNGRLTLESTDGIAGQIHCYLNFTDGVRITTDSTYGAMLQTDTIATSAKEFQFPNISGTIVTTAGALANVDLGAYTFGAGATTVTSLDAGSGAITTTGTITGGPITIFSPTPILVFQDSNSLGAASVGYIEWKDSGGGRAGFFGNNSSGNDDLYWKNEQGGNIGIETTGSGEVQIFSNLQMGNDKLIAVDVNSNITASTTRTQGQGALTAQVNEISTVANNDDTVTLPSAITGIEIEIINNGAKTLQIFPASGDNLGLGTDTAEELEANERVKFVAYDTDNWAKESTTEIIHAEIHDEDNTDPFVINAEDDFHSYHTNGLAAGDLADWAFDAGGAGTSHAIDSIDDGVDTGNDIEVTTGTDHLLAIGDIVSQTNLADTNYVGVFVVKAIISSTQYEVAAPFNLTGTGTMDQAATLEADAVAAGVYDFAYYISGKPVGANETFDFQLYNDATAIIGSKVRRKFGGAGDFGSMAGGGVVAVGTGDKISFALSNEDSAANLIVRNLTIVLIRL